jgi:hypothetical protein
MQRDVAGSHLLSTGNGNDRPDGPVHGQLERPLSGADLRDGGGERDRRRRVGAEPSALSLLLADEQATPPTQRLSTVEQSQSHSVSAADALRVVIAQNRI